MVEFYHSVASVEGKGTLKGEQKQHLILEFVILDAGLNQITRDVPVAGWPVIHNLTIRSGS